MKLSSVFTDMAYLGLAGALFNIAQEATPSEGIIMVEEDSKSAEKISYRMNKLNTRILKTMKKYRHMVDYAILPLQKKLLERAVEVGNEVIQPDYLAIYVLRFRFIRTKRELHSDLQWLTKKGGDLLAIMDLLDETKVSDRDEEMCDLAYELANYL